jgi:hypothetical protein
MKKKKEKKIVRRSKKKCSACAICGQAASEKWRTIGLTHRMGPMSVGVKSGSVDPSG